MTTLYLSTRFMILKRVNGYTMTCKNKPCDNEVTGRKVLFCSSKCNLNFSHKKQLEIKRADKNKIKFKPFHNLETKHDLEKLFVLYPVPCRHKIKNLSELRIFDYPMHHMIVDKRKTRMINLSMIKSRVLHYDSKLNKNYHMTTLMAYKRWVECWEDCIKYLEGLK